MPAQATETAPCADAGADAEVIEMQAAVLRMVPGELEIEDLTVDAIGPHELLVRTAHSGLCHSDLHFIDGVWAMVTLK